MVPKFEQKMSANELNAFMEQHLPQIGSPRSGGLVVEKAEGGYVEMRMPFAERMLRPGGTISGPAMFALADVAMYAAVLSAIGPRPLAVTTNLNINFLRKPSARDMIAEARLLKLGRRLAVGEISLFSDGETDLAAHATSTYALPEE